MFYKFGYVQNVCAIKIFIGCDLDSYVWQNTTNRFMQFNIWFKMERHMGL